MLSKKENALKLYRHETPEFLPIMGQGIINNVPVNGYLERAADGQDGYDWFGVHWMWKPGEPAPVPGPDFILDDISDWKEIVKFPDLDSYDWESAARTDRIPEFNREENLLYQMIHNGLFERLHTLMGFEEALCALLTDPDEVKDFFWAMADYKCRLIDKIAKYYKPDIICYHDDWGTQRGLFFSPDIWRELLKEPTKQIVDHTHSLGILFELHSCGDIHDLVPEIAEDLKVDGLNIMKLNDIPALKKITGNKVVYNVYFDTQKLDVLAGNRELSEEEIRAAIREDIMTLAPGGCFIPALLLVRPEWQPIILDEYEKCKFCLDC